MAMLWLCYDYSTATMTMLWLCAAMVLLWLNYVMTMLYDFDVFFHGYAMLWLCGGYAADDCGYVKNMCSGDGEGILIQSFVFKLQIEVAMLVTMVAILCHGHVMAATATTACMIMNMI